MEDLCDVKKADNIALFVADRLMRLLALLQYARGTQTYQMTEVLLNHELQRLGSAGGVASDHRVPRHDLLDGSMMRVDALRGNLSPTSQ